MSTYVWLAHSGEYDDYTVWGAFASVESWWDQVYEDFAEICPTVVPVSDIDSSRVSIRPTCRCRMEERKARWGNWLVMEHPHEGYGHFNSAGLFREEVLGSPSTVKPEQAEVVAGPTATVWEICTECSVSVGMPHAENCSLLTHFPAPEYVHPKPCKWKKAGEKCAEDALDGDDQFCALHLEKVLAGRQANEFAKRQQFTKSGLCLKCGGPRGGNATWCPPCSGALTFPHPWRKS